MAWIRCEDGTLCNAARVELISLDGHGRTWRVWLMDARGRRFDLASGLEEDQARRLLDHLANHLPLHGSLSGLVDVRSVVDGLKREPFPLRVLGEPS